ncbi:hypothetical protein NDU88_001225, partial [Pleurodeles waltl]
MAKLRYLDRAVLCPLMNGHVRVSGGRVSPLKSVDVGVCSVFLLVKGKVVSRTGRSAALLNSTKRA